MAEDCLVLIVDDDEPSVELLRLYLNVLGFQHQSAFSGQEALEIIRADPDRIGMLLLDLAMPEMNGYQVCKIIRADPELSGIPIVALTANVEAELEVKVQQAGFDDLITKPFSRDGLKAALNDHFRS